LLVVDDEDLLRESLTFEFERRGFDVVSAAGGWEAFRVIESQPIDLVVSDIRMPDGDGVELLDRIKSRDLKLPVIIFITAYSSLDNADAYAAGAEEIFPKPFDRKELLAAVKRGLLPLARRCAEPPVEKVEGGPVKAGPAAGRAVRLGRGGFFLEGVEGVPEPGRLVGFEIQLGNDPGDSFQGVGRVRWKRSVAEQNRPLGAGISLVYLAPENRDRAVALFEGCRDRAVIPLA